MKYQEILAHSNDRQALAYLGRVHGLELNPRALPEKLQEAVVQRLSDAAYLESCISRLPPDEQFGLQVLVFGSQVFLPTPDSVHRHLNELTQKASRHGAKIIATLVEKGLVFAGKDHDYRSVYLVPEEARTAVFALTAHRLACSVSDLPTQPTNGLDPLTLLNNLHLFLAWLARTPVRLTQAGLLYRRDQQHLLAHFNPPEEPAPASGPAAYPPQLDLFLNFANKHDLTAPALGEEGTPYLALTAKAERWMRHSLERQLEELVTYLKNRLERSPGTPGMLLALLGCVPETNWLDLKALLQHLVTCATDPWYRPEQEVRAALAQLAGLGLVETAGSSSRQYVRLTAGGRRFHLGILPSVKEEETFLVQPDYDVLVPQELKPALRWELETYAELVKNDRMVVLRLSEDSIYQAFKRGKDLSGLLSFLRQHSRVPLPENVAYSVEEWCRRCGALYLEQPLLLTCRSEELAAEVAADPRFQPYLRGRLTPRHLLVDPDKFNELLDALEDAGHRPHPGIAKEAGLEAKLQTRWRDQRDTLRELMGLLKKGTGRSITTGAAPAPARPAPPPKRGR